MIQLIKSRIQSFRHAFDGLAYVLRTQKNAWVHSISTVLVAVVGIWLRLDLTEWALIVLAVGFVWTAELINSALEAVVDLASDGKLNNLAKLAKDVGAAAVLIAAASSVVIGGLVLLPHILERFH